MDDEQNRNEHHSTPIPDPTLLTTQQLNREVTSVREILKSQIDGLNAVLSARLDGMDKTIKLMQMILDKLPIQIDDKIMHLKDLHQQKFDSIEIQFKERDIRTEQTSRDSKVAVDAALSAAKEAVGEQNRSAALAILKSETATVKQIDQQALFIQNTQKSFDDKINDVKDRLTRIEGSTSGKEAGVDKGWAILLAVATLVSVAVAMVTLIAHFTSGKV